MPEAALREQIGAVLAAWGFSGDAVQAGVDGLVYADLRGIASHGIAMLPIYEQWLSQGRFEPDAVPRIERENAVSASVDGGSALGFLPAGFGMRIAIDKARQFGVAAVGVRRSNHFGAAGHYASMATEQGLIGLATSNTVAPAIVPTGAREAMFGTNPIAFAAPASRNPAFLLDMATSTVALGKLMVAAYRNQAIPAGWALGPDGKPTTDAALGYRTRLATPLGALPELSSHKGTGLAAMVEIVSALLTGARPSMSSSPQEPGDVGHFFLVLDPAVFRGDGGFGDALDAFVDRLRAAAPVEPGVPVQAAGDPEHRAARLAARDGVVLPAPLLDALRSLARRAGCRWVLGGAGAV